MALTTPVAALAAEKSRFWKRRRGIPSDWPWAILFLGPNIVLFLVFMAYPVIYGLYMSLFNWKIIQPPKWVGLGNYQDFFSDPLTPRIIWQSLYYAGGSTIPLVLLSLLCAVLLNSVIRGKHIWRGIYFLPLVTSPVAAASVWSWLYARDQGLINYFIVKLGFSPIDWLFNTTWAMPSLIFMTIWKLLPFNTILYIAGLQEIPAHLYEAAAIDGASRWRQFKDITLPLITPTTFFVLMITLMNMLFGSFDLIAVMTQGGPLQSTNVVIYNIYQNAFQYFRMGYASAQAYILFLFVFLLTIASWRIQRRWVHYT